ncbi:MAG: tryptophan--tRNA ligase [Cyanobacteria bacterium SIG30]|nr:tryptophan--tRNA ligase [Cyanobacteria bacterium SIG30]
MNNKIIVSGMRSTGKLHLGHYFGVIKNWVELQKEFNCYYFVADWHALTTKFNQTENLRQNVLDVTMDWLASGIDPDKSTIYVQSHVPQIAQLHILLSMITPQNWVERDPTLKDMAKILRMQKEEGKSETSSASYGLIGYPVLMTSDIMMFNANYVPVGIDQVAHIEISRDIIRRFNNIYNTDYFVEPEPKLTQVPLLKGLDGNKMGKSFNNDIKISDDEETTTKKIMTGITDRTRLRKTDLGHPDNCEVIFDYWKIFGNDTEIEEIESMCKKGEIGCADCKRKLAQKVNEYFAPIREKRKKYEENPKLVEEILIEGSKKAQLRAQEVLDKAKEAIKMF